MWCSFDQRRTTNEQHIEDTVKGRTPDVSREICQLFETLVLGSGDNPGFNPVLQSVACNLKLLLPESPHETVKPGYHSLVRVLGLELRRNARPL